MKALLALQIFFLIFLSMLAQAEDSTRISFHKADDTLASILKEAGLKLEPGKFELLRASANFTLPPKQTALDARFFLNIRLYQELYAHDKVTLISADPYRVRLELDKTLFTVSSEVTGKFLSPEEIAEMPKLASWVEKVKMDYPLKAVLVQYGTKFNRVFNGGVTTTLIYDLGPQKGTLLSVQGLAAVSIDMINFLGDFSFFQDQARDTVAKEVKKDVANFIRVMRKVK